MLKHSDSTGKELLFTKTLLPWSSPSGVLPWWGSSSETFSHHHPPRPQVRPFQFVKEGEILARGPTLYVGFLFPLRTLFDYMYYYLFKMHFLKASQGVLKSGHRWLQDYLPVSGAEGRHNEWRDGKAEEISTQPHRLKDSNCHPCLMNRCWNWG